jgi:hypothetical protein
VRTSRTASVLRRTGRSADLYNRESSPIFREPAFYSYTAPEPEGLTEHRFSSLYASLGAVGAGGHEHRLGDGLDMVLVTILVTVRSHTNTQHPANTRKGAHKRAP